MVDACRKLAGDSRNHADWIVQKKCSFALLLKFRTPQYKRQKLAKKLIFN
jgi:DNA-directed RNA polymerase subunit RPC12/RpoP